MVRTEAQPTRLGTHLARRWMRFWFAPGSAANLGFCRLVSVGLFFFLFETRSWAGWAGMDDVLWLPTPLFRALDLRPLSGPGLQLIALVCKVALLLAAVGFMTRTSAAVAAVSMFYLLGVRHNFGKIFYNDAGVPLILAILATARSGDRWSVDHLLRRLTGRVRNRAGESDVPAAEYTWPVRLVWLLTVTIFFAAGIAKLRCGGVEWILSDQLSEVLIGQHHSYTPPATRIGLVLAEHKGLCRMFAGLVVALETLSALALVSARARAIIVPGLVAFTLSLPLIFGFHFTEHFAMFAFWVPWNRLRATVPR